MSKRIVLQVPPGMAAQFASLGLAGGQLVFDALDPVPETVAEAADTMAVRLDAEARLGGAVIATFRSGNIGKSLTGADFVDGLALRAEGLGLWPEPVGAN